MRRAWALAATLLAACRTAWWLPRLPLDELALRLRRGRPYPPGLRDPRLYHAVVTRWAPLLPPHGIGPCLKRSLLLLDLWSRCGLAPRLHVGVALSATGRRAHAWVTPDPVTPAPPAGSFDEALVL